jgi:hypothetical protein
MNATDLESGTVFRVKGRFGDYVAMHKSGDNMRAAQIYDLSTDKPRLHQQSSFLFSPEEEVEAKIGLIEILAPQLTSAFLAFARRLN